MRYSRMILAIVVAAAASPAPAAEPAALSRDVAELSTRVCFPISSGELSFDPSDLAGEKRVLNGLGLKAGVPAGVLDGFTPQVAATFNRAILASRPNGASQLLVAIGGELPSCRVTVSGVPGIIDVKAIDEELTLRNGWTRFPAQNRSGGPIARHSFLRRDAAGRAHVLDILVVQPPQGTFRLMAITMPAHPSLKLPDGF